MTILTPQLIQTTGLVPEMFDNRTLYRIEEIFCELDRAETLVFLDTEATGNGVSTRLVEVGAYEVDLNEQPAGGIRFRVNPHRKSSAGAKKVHGIYDCELEHCREYGYYADELRAYLRGKTVVIHDKTSDLRWLNYEYSLIDPTLPPIETEMTVVDSLEIAKLLSAGRRKNGLDALCRWYGYERSGLYHDAYSDAVLLSRVFFELWWEMDDVLNG